MNEAELVFSEILDCSRISLYEKRESKLKNSQCLEVASILKRRLSGEPIQYIFNKTEFMGLEFGLSRDVFIPRPETEILVERALALAQGHLGLEILDLGTGSGCIAVSLAKFIAGANLAAVDISSAALAVARFNAVKHKVSDRIEFIQGDLFLDLRLDLADFDIIVSNPPYILRGEIARLEPEVQFEPRVALDGGGDGLDFYRRIIDIAGLRLKEVGFLILEVGYNQALKVEKIAEGSGFFKLIEIVRDYNNIDRVIILQKDN